MVKTPCSAGDLGLIPGSGRSPGEGSGNPLQYSCLENPTDRGAWQATVLGVARVRHDLATKPPPASSLSKMVFGDGVFGGMKTQQWPQDWKRSVFIPIPKKGNDKEYSNYRTIALISHTSKVMLKILQARLQQYVNCELPDVETGFRKGRGTRDQIANIRWIIEKARE